jgi:hypothetical protein
MTFVLNSIYFIRLSASNRGSFFVCDRIVESAQLHPNQEGIIYAGYATGTPLSTSLEKVEYYNLRTKYLAIVANSSFTLNGDLGLIFINYYLEPITREDAVFEWFSKIGAVRPE